MASRSRRDYTAPGNYVKIVCQRDCTSAEGFLQVRSGGGEKAKQFTGLQKWATA